MPDMTRRNLLFSLPAAGMAARAMAQSGKPTIPVRSLSHMTLSVTDPQRSLEFYQGLFGMPIQARQGPTMVLGIGSGPQFVALGRVGPNGKPGINHWCMTTERFNVDRTLAILAEHGIAKSDSNGAMKVRVRMRGPENGGAKEGTPEMYIGDPDGIVVQIQDTSYCGGAGVLGSVCPAKPEPAPKKGLIALTDLSHFTIFVSDAQRALDFYQSLFAMPIQAHQGATPLLAVGSGGQFLTIAGGGGGRGRAGGAAPMPGINHASFRMRGFNPDKVMKTLAEYGIKPREQGARGPAGPLVSYVTMRMPDRGGSPGGTPELYFTDPDGILLQIQDTSYCGGSGALGEVCVP
ncbi:MAG TPA: VOC family protein [Bryobacteraceae bacterium]|nr:VOC family protein [Bryobacteraceae bacterium]